MKRKIKFIMTFFILSFALVGCADDFEPSYEFSDIIEMPSPKNDGRGEPIENLVTLYGEDYIDNPYLNDAVINARRWHWSNSYNELNNKTVESPEYLDVFRLQAELYLINQDNEAALSQLDQILKLYPDDAHALSVSILAEFLLGNEENYTARWNDLNKINPNFANDVKEAFLIAEKWTKKEYSSELINDFKPEVIAVFGERPNPDNTITPGLVHKVSMAKELLEQHPDAKILLSGGPVHQEASEAEVMKEWLLENDVKSEQVILDELARDTVGNAIGIVEYMREEELEKVVGVADFSHLPRALANLDAYSIFMNYEIEVYGVGTGRNQEPKTGRQTSPYTYYNVFKSYGLINKSYYEGYTYENN